MNAIKLIRAALLAAAAALLLGGCQFVQPGLTSKPEVYRDAPVLLSPLEVYVHPVRPERSKPLSALILPFQVQQMTERPDLIGKQAAQIFWQTWNSRRVFPTSMYDEKLAYRSPEHAMAMARYRGARLAIVGFVPYFYVSGSAGDSSITVHIRIYDTVSGELLVSFQQAGRMEDRMTEDFIWADYKTRLSEAPLHVILANMAVDMSIPLKSWSVWANSGQATPRFAETSQEIVASLSEQPQEAAPMQAFEEKITPPAPVAPPKAVQGAKPVNKSEGHADKLARDLAEKSGKAEPYVDLNIEFDFDSAKIRPASYPTLDALGQALSSPALAGKKIEIIGHTDAMGTPEYNLELSKARAVFVKNYLVDKFHLPPENLLAKGKGESEPLVPGTDETNRQINRRVQIRLADNQ